MRHLALFFVLVGMFSYRTAWAQDPGFSQFYANPIYLNPALAGSTNQYRFTAVYRQQLASDIGYSTAGISLDGIFRTENIGWGVMAIQDSQGGGVLTNTSVNGVLALKTKVAKNAFVSMGAQFGYYQKYLDWDNLTFEDQINERYGIIQSTNEQFGRSTVVNGDIGVGVLYHSNNLFGGVAISHINNPKEDFSLETEVSLPVKYTLHVGGRLNPASHVYNDITFSPNVIYQKQGRFEYLNLGMYASWESMVLGAWYRVGHAAIILVGLSKKQYRLGYSYDMVIANGTQGNAHEITLTYLLKPKEKVKSRFYKGKCPKFQQNLF